MHVHPQQAMTAGPVHEGPSGILLHLARRYTTVEYVSQADCNSFLKQYEMFFPGTRVDPSTMCAGEPCRSQPLARPAA